MDPALDILNRALVGDHGALSFLDRTSSIYVLDATDPSKPKTYGGWNFIHQAMNEVERQEAHHHQRQLQQGHGKGPSGHVGGGGAAGDGSTAGTPSSTNAALRDHVQLLASIAQRIARRSPMIDRNLVATCVANASQHQTNTETAQAEALINLNSEIREIVMGRIAAMAFDFSFHGRNRVQPSAFSDPVAMEKLCGVLAANAVSSGPGSITHFMKEWIIPSARTLPPFAVASVTYHLALESGSRNALAGTKDTLQHLSHSIVSLVLAPVLHDAVHETNESPSSESNHSWNSRVAAIAIRALERWCSLTDLSLPQVKHVCAKVKVRETHRFDTNTYILFLGYDGYDTLNMPRNG